MTSTTASIFGAATCLILLAGCDTPTAIQVQQVGRTLAPSVSSIAAPNPRTIRGELGRLGRQNPGFTGVFFDENGNLTLSVATDTFSPHAKARVLGWARAFSAGARGKRISSIRRVPFDYATLDARYDQILNTVEAADSLQMSAIDETRGIILLGVLNLNVVERITARLATIGIPPAMVTFVQSGPATAETNLTQISRPTIGGIRVMRPGNPSPYACSIGFNIYKGNQQTGPDPSQGKFFLTASHCSSQQGVFLGTEFYQDSTVAGRRIGAEVAVAPKGACPGDHTPCQLADVLVVRYDDTVSVHYGRVAEVDASKNIIGYYDLATNAGMSGGLTGETVTKVGYKTGMSTGVITLSCSDQLLQGVWILCMQEANYLSDAGDSGAGFSFRALLRA